MFVRTGPKRILAIDWDARTLRVVHALLDKRALQIDRLLSVAIPDDVDPNSPSLMGRHIRRVLDQEAIGTKHAIVDIPPGRYQYRLVIDGVWQADPYNANVQLNEYGEHNSVLVVGQAKGST